jgi:hypothetical protein
MKLGMVILFSLFLLAPDSGLNAQEWKNFVPLKTTRANVEAILGPADEGFEVTYSLKDGNLSIEYSSGPCKSGRKGGWNVPKDVVISLLFSPRRPKKVSELRLDLTKFKKVIDEHLPSVTYYINDEDGITYAIQKGKVDYVEYGPSKKYDDLYCKDQP